MRAYKKFLICLAAASVVGALSTSATATAATTFGNTCVGDNTSPSTVTQLSQATGNLPLSAPVSGVITKWGTSVITYPGGLSERLKVLRPTGAANTFQVVGESKIEPVVSGVNSYPTQIPIQAGDKIGAFGSPATLICSTASVAADVAGVAPGDQGINSTTAYTPTEKIQVPLTATIEPDGDNDGFGDETQDKCPQSAAVQVACPILRLEAVSQTPLKGSVRILVAASFESSITVSASAKTTGKSKKAKSSAVTKLTPITQSVVPGQIAAYTLNFTRALKTQLAALPRTKTLKLSVVAEGKSVAGAVTTAKLTVKLKGRAGS